MAAFLIAVEEGAVLGCNGWQEDFGRPLGAPAGPPHPGARTRPHASTR